LARTAVLCYEKRILRVTTSIIAYSLLTTKRTSNRQCVLSSPVRFAFQMSNFILISVTW